MALAFGLSPREVERVADESPATFEAMVEAARSKWTADTELLAGLVEMTHATYRLIASANGVKPADLPDPVKVPRPDRADQTKKRKTATGGELRRWVAQHRGG